MRALPKVFACLALCLAGTASLEADDSKTDLERQVEAVLDALRLQEPLRAQVEAHQGQRWPVVDALWRRKEQDAAAAYARSWVEVAQSASDHGEPARALHALGVVLSRADRHSVAIDPLERAAKQYERVGDALGQGRALNLLGVARLSIGRHEDALRDLERAGALAVATRDQLAAAAACNNAGLALKDLGRFEEARRRFTKARGAYEALDNGHGVSRVLNNLGLVSRGLGAYAQALEYHGHAQRVATGLKYDRMVANALSGAALVNLETGHYEEARDALARALAIYRRLNMPRMIAGALGNIGIVQRRLGAYRQALEQFQAAIVVEETLDDRAGVARSLGNMAVVHALLGEHDQALALYKSSLELKTAVGEVTGQISTLLNMGSLLARMGRRAEAETAYTEAAELLRAYPDQRNRMRLATAQASLHFAKGEDDKAVARAKEGVDLLAESLVGLAEEQGARTRDWYDRLFDVGLRAAFRRGLHDALIWFLESGRARSLCESLGSRDRLERALLRPETLAYAARARTEERRAREAYIRARQREKLDDARVARRAWEAARVDRDRASRSIQRESKRAADLTLSRPSSLRQIQASLGPSDALLYYALAGEDGLAVVVHAEGVAMTRLAPSRQIEAATAALLSADRGIDPAALPRLRALLVTPLDLGVQVRRVLVSPAGGLGYVPFALLFPEQEVVYVPSGTTLGLLAEGSGKTGTKVLGVGDPEYRAKASEDGLRLRKSTLPPLPATKREVEAVANLRLLGKDATETGLQDALEDVVRWRSVHLACHGLIDTQRPMLSALALTADDENDGFLTALETLRMRVPSDLVVLSACNTARGKIYKTEGIVGLARAFMYAGASRVLCSLWKVDDAATQALMIRFYELWNPKDGTKGLGAAAALKQAQAYVRAFRDQDGKAPWTHPNYWAAWVLWGLPD